MCKFCDTNFVGTDGPGGGLFAHARRLAEAARSQWPKADHNLAKPFLICTGGEPLLQLDDELVREFHTAGFEVAIETNGTMACPADVDWVCVSPKAGTKLVLKSGDELKLVFPQPDAPPELFENLKFGRFYLQPMDGPHLDQNTKLAQNYCLMHPQWRMSLQVHKLLGIP